MNFEVSNNLDSLSKILKKDIFKGTLFDNKLLILPSEQFKGWLVNKWTEKESDIIAGIQFTNLESSIFYLLNYIKDYELHFLSPFELKLLIYNFLSKMNQESLDPVLGSYLSKDKDRRLVYLSNILSDLFQNYITYGIDLLGDLKNATNWQEKLFYKIFYEQNNSFLLKEYPFKIEKKLDIKIFIFGFSYLPEIYFNFFYCLSKVTEVFIYYPRITSGFWEDIRSTKEERIFQKKYFSNQFNLQDWALKMYETNTLIANFGALGKRYERTIGNYDIEYRENYIEKTENSLLNTVQNQILNLTPLDEKEKFIIDEKTASINIQEINGSKLEEIKVVYKNIQTQLIKDNIRINDILVLAPDINQYFSYIKMVFDRKCGAIDYKIHDIKLTYLSNLAKGIVHILALSDSDWALDDILVILDNPLVRSKFKIEQSDLEFFNKLIEKTKLRFSYNEKHKVELVGYQNINGTWEESFQKIIMAYATFQAEFHEDTDLSFDGQINQSDLIKIEPIFQVISSLYDDLKDFKQTKLNKLGFFVSKFLILIEKYFYIPNELNEQTALEFFKSCCLKLNKIDLELDISFLYFRKLILKDLNKQTATLNAHLCDGIQFGSLGNDKWPAFEHIYMIGMENEAFPKRKAKNSLDLLKHGKSPTLMQFERFMFLTIITKAEKSLWISYPSQAGLDKTSSNLPSFLVQEFELFLNKHYTVNGLTYKMWNQYSNNKKPDIKSKNLISSKLLSINHPSSLILGDHFELTTYELALLAKNPISFYLEKKHKIVLTDLFDTPEEDFFLTPLNKTIFLQEKIEGDHKIDFNNLLPDGIFRDIAVNQLDSEIKILNDNAKFFDINLNQLFDVELSIDVDHVLFDNKTMFLPAINLNLKNKQITITGKIKHVHKKGLVFFKEKTIYELVKNWPVILLFGLIAKKNNFCSDMFFLKSKKTKSILKLDEEKFLKEFISYYFVARENIFPFTKSLINYIFKKDLKAVNQTLKQLLVKNVKYQDPYEKFFVKYFAFNINEDVFFPWANYLNEIYYPINEL
jgi:exonuclease V gamma subunit